MIKKYIATIGFFDGIHIGHQKLIRLVKKLAEINNCEMLLYTFDKVNKDNKSLIFPLDEKIKILKTYEVDNICLLRFDNIRNLLPEEFFYNFIVKKNVISIVAGEDFRFGKNAKGNIQTLLKLGKKFNILITIIKDVYISLKNKIYSVSSSLIRQKISECQFDEVEKLLGREYWISGIVTKGRGLGRKIGFPTINFVTDKNLLLPYGVIAGYCEINGKKYKSVANFGKRLSFGDKELVPEVHVIDKDFYPCEFYKIKFRPIKKIREEKKFISVFELKKQIQRDVNIAEQILS